MKAIERLMNEHRQIEAVLTSLERYCDDLQSSGATDKSRLEKFVEFLLCFADTIHHGKEEELLFKAMEDCGFPAEQGPIAVMLEDHEQGRRFIQTMSDAAGLEEDWSAEVRSGLVQAGNGYAALLSAHIEKEDNILYRMAKDALSQEAMDRLDADCASFDEAHNGELARLGVLAGELR
ncbi:MAG: hemerythrin [Rhodobacteraceae bacterium]|nr:hemerythrin [Paracoccaceae bacterium]